MPGKGLLLAVVAGLFLFSSLLSAQNNPLNSDHVTWDVLTPKLEGAPGEKVKFKFRANLKSGVHLYTQKRYPDSIFGPTSTEMSTGGSKRLKRSGGLRANKGAVKAYDENFETETAFWKGKVTFTVSFAISKSAKPGDVEEGWVNLYYQTCDDNSCKPPLDSRFNFKVKVLEDVAAKQDSIKKAAADSADAADSVAAYQDSVTAYQDSIAAMAAATAGIDAEDLSTDDEPLTVSEQIEKSKSEGLFSYLLLAMSFGLVALVTPCVFPMIPITVSFFTKREQATRAQAVKDASIYAVGIIFTFTALGAIVSAIYGAAGIGAMATNPWVNMFIAGIFLAFALSLFGMFDIQVPSGILNKLNAKASSGSGITSILLMGFVFSLTSFTCTVPFVGSALAAVGQGGSWFWPIIGMAAFATVFALPFFLLALFPSLLKSMPKSGGWLNVVKVVMGFVEVAAAMKFLSNAELIWDWGILTREVVLAVWIAVALMGALYLLGRYQLPHDTPVEKISVPRMLFSLSFFAASFWLLTGLFGAPLGEVDAFLPPQEYPGKGNTSIFASIAERVDLAPPSYDAVAGDNKSEDDLAGVSDEEPGTNLIKAEGMTWYKDNYQAALEKAKETGKPLFIDFTGYTCTNCRWVEANLFKRDDIRALMNQYVLVRLYTDRRVESNKRNRQMQIDRFKTIDLPFYVLMTPDDKPISETLFTRDAELFKSFLRRGIKAVKGKATEEIVGK